MQPVLPGKACCRGVSVRSLVWRRQRGYACPLRAKAICELPGTVPAQRHTGALHLHINVPLHYQSSTSRAACGHDHARHEGHLSMALNDALSAHCGLPAQHGRIQHTCGERSGLCGVCRPGPPMPRLLREGLSESMLKGLVEEYTPLLNKGIALAHRVMTGRDAILAGKVSRGRWGGRRNRRNASAVPQAGTLTRSVQ